MPAVQTTYNPRIAVGVPGQVRSMVNFNSISRFLESTAAGFGLAICQGVADKGAILGGTLAGFLGATMKDITLPTTVGRGTSNIDKFLQHDHMGLLTTGEIWVRPVGAVAAMDPVYFNATTGVFGNASGTGIVGPIVGAHFVTSCASGEIAVLSLGIQK